MSNLKVVSACTCVHPECKKEFEIKLQTRPTEIMYKGQTGIEQNYFICPHCGHEYHCIYTSFESRTAQGWAEYWRARSHNMGSKRGQRVFAAGKVDHWQAENRRLLELLNPKEAGK